MLIARSRAYRNAGKANDKPINKFVAAKKIGQRMVKRRASVNTNSQNTRQERVKSASVAAAMMSLQVMQEEPWRMMKVRENAAYMRDELTKMGFETGPTTTAIVPIYVRQDFTTIAMWKVLLDEHDIYVNPFIAPGVPPKGALLRTSYMATHERQHLDRGLEAFRAVGKQFGLIS